MVLFDERGQPVSLAHYQVPQYRRGADGGGSGLIEAAVKATVIGSLVAAGAMVVQEVLDSIDRDLKKEIGKAKTSRKRKRSPSR